MVQPFSHIAVPARGILNIDFPFNLLPLELKALVLRHVLPRHGILPKEPRAQDFNQDEDWSTEETGIFWKYLDKNKRALDANVDRNTTADADEARVLLPLLLVSKHFADVAGQTFTDIVPLVINITPVCVHFLETVKSVSYEYLSYKSFLEFHQFRCMRTFELNLDFAQQWWHDRFEEPLNTIQGIWWGRQKEWLRTICDLLSTNDDIRQLTVRFPCLCHLEKEAPELVEQAERILLNLFSPLKRLKVANRVQFIWSHNMDGLEAINDEPEFAEDESHPNEDKLMANNGIPKPDTQPRHSCSNDTHGGTLGKTIRQRFSQLTGETLSHHEATWKRIKAMNRYRTHPSSDIRLGWSSSIEERLETVLGWLEKCQLYPHHSSVAYHRHCAAFDAAAYDAVQRVLGS
ncbi:MAG: hypothetical protein Q9184_006228 [Pyrenodesmia sp. 2 TL-2023]